MIIVGVAAYFFHLLLPSVAFFLFSIIKKIYQKKNKYLTFQWNLRWIKKADTTFHPFDLYISVCNFYIFRLCLFNRGFETKIKWYDAIAECDSDDIKKRK